MYNRRSIVAKDNYLEDGLLNIRKFGLLLIALVAVFALGACSPGFGSPEGAAESFFNAYEAQNEDDMRDAVCEQYRDQITLLDQDDDDETEVELDFDLKFVEVEDDDGDDNTTLIEVYGSLNQRLITEERDINSSIHSRGDTPLFPHIVMRKNGDDWQLCDDRIIASPLSVALSSNAQ